MSLFKIIAFFFLFLFIKKLLDGLFVFLKIKKAFNETKQQAQGHYQQQSGQHANQAPQGEVFEANYTVISED